MFKSWLSRTIKLSHNTIVKGDKNEATDVNPTVRAIFPFLIWVKRPDTCPPGTNKAKATAAEKMDEEKILDAAIPINGKKIICRVRP